jgi:2-dehydropantoate 2-reductase
MPQSQEVRGAPRAADDAVRIVVLGAGAVGGYFGGRLAASGFPVTFVARGAQLDALRTRGLAIRSRLGDATVTNVPAFADPRAVAANGPFDFVVFAVKLYDTAAAIMSCAPLVGEHTCVLSLQNGIDGVRQLASAFGCQRVLGGVAKIAAVVTAPGSIEHTGEMAQVTFGELDGSSTKRVDELRTAFSTASVDHVVTETVLREIWDKLVFLSVFSSLSALFRQAVGEWRDDPEVIELARDCFSESYEVANAYGAALAAETVAQKVQRLAELPGEMCASMLEDLRRGRRLELEWLSGAIIRLGAARGIRTPKHRFLYRALKPFADGSPPHRT